MTDKDKIEFLLKLADVHWRDYSERRSIEWKTNFGLWIALGAFSAFMFENRPDLRCWLRIMFSALLGIMFIVYTFVWKVEIMERNTADKAAAQHYWDQVVKEMVIKKAVIVRSQNV